MIMIEPSSTTGGSASGAPKELAMTASFGAESPQPEEEALQRKKKQSLPTPPPNVIDQPRAEGVGTSAGALEAPQILLDTTGVDRGNIKTLMEQLFAHHTKGNDLLLQVSDKVKTLEHDLERSSEDCAQAKELHLKVRTQLRAQHDSFHLMKNDYEGMRSEKIKIEKELSVLRVQVHTADARVAEVGVRAEEAIKQAEAATKRAEEAEGKNKELELLVQMQKEQLSQSDDTIRLQTDQMRNLKENVQSIVEGWSSREADWLRGPIAPASPNVLAPSLREKVIEEYKTSGQFHEDVQDAVVNEFNDGFEFARELVRGKGHDPDALGIVIPDN